MNVLKKYWNSVYVYVLLLIPCTCMCAGTYWTICKMLGFFSDVSWYAILVFDGSQLIYLAIGIYFICQIRKDSDYISNHLRRVKGFAVITLFIQYNFIMYLFPSYFVWECTFIFFALLAFLFDSKLMVWNMIIYIVALFIAHLANIEKFFPLEDKNLTELIAWRFLMIGVTSVCIFFIVYFAEHFLIQAQERNRENIHLLNKQVKYYKDIELVDKELRRFRHDIRNHFICMEALLENGQEEKLRNYFQELHSGFAFQERVYFSGNEIVDAILNCDLAHDCKEGVQITVYGELSKMQTISDIDLCTLFSNLLSNAITAANDCIEYGESELIISFSSGKKYFSISMSNTVRGEWSMEKQRRIAAGKNHGYGVQKIMEIVEKYNGNIEQETQQGMVKIQVYLPV